jgi:DNA-binding MarR family transcriptional regulator
MLDDVITRCAGVRTLSAARAVNRYFDAALRPAELTITQFTLLVIIAARSPDSISQIGDWLSIERTSVTRNLKPLERRGFVARGAEGAARMRAVSLTKEGLKKLKAAYPLWKVAQGELEGTLDGDLQSAMKSLAALRRLDTSISPRAAD